MNSGDYKGAYSTFTKLLQKNVSQSSFEGKLDKNMLYGVKSIRPNNGYLAPSEINVTIIVYDREKKNRKTANCTFEVKKEDGEWKIDSYDM